MRFREGAPLLFFASLGIGYCAVVIFVVEMAVRMLGLNAFSVVVLPLFMLLSSAFAGRFTGTGSYPVTTARRRCAVLVGLLLITVLVVPEFAAESEGWGGEKRLLTALLMTGSTGFLLGLPLSSATALLRARPGMLGRGMPGRILLLVFCGAGLVLAAALAFGFPAVRLAGPSACLAAAVTVEDL